MKKFIVIFLLILLSGCKEKLKVQMNDDTNKVKEAVAVLEPLNNSGVHGIVNFREGNGYVEITAKVYGLSRGDHGIHIHKFGDLRSDKGDFLDGHYNPTNTKHGNKGKDGGHLGDLGNIYALNDSTAQFDKKRFKLSLNGKYSILGRSIVIHQGEDDLVTQPSGNSGMKVAAGVIGIKDNEM